MATPPTTSTIKVALAGAGWAEQVHTLAAAAVPGITIPAVATRSLESARAFAELVGGEGVGIEELPAAADAVVVATPPTSHADIAVAMLERGVPVLVEKPLACTLAEADAIVDAAQRNGVAACYAENLLFAPALDL
ncbi:MAG TPA: Gfo/Idh/MocA family oxidoreductase, partial [Microthrixaceae bacterium]|nr:Gfo/Idh/MocA family oxidoreductase [Microthrixaceae bacterium]